MHSKTVLITGALSGIGKATTELFITRGYNVVFSGRRADEGARMLEAFRAVNEHVIYVNADMSNGSDLRNLVDIAVSKFGSLDVAVNSAGVEGDRESVAESIAKNFHNVFNINVLSILLAMKHQLPVMVSQRRGSLINLSSVAGLIGVPHAAIYVASKHAVEGLTKTAALEVAATGVRVNAVSPGPVESKMFDRFVGNDATVKNIFREATPNQRLATVNEIAHTIYFLADDNVTAITGQTITVDGGYSTQ